MNQLLQSASGLSASDLAASKAQFDSTVARLKQNIDSATYIDPATGTASNLLDNAGFSLTITPTAGHSFTFQGTDLSSLKSALDSAQAQFDALGVGATPAGTIASDLSSARTTSVATNDYLNTQQRTYNTLLENVDPNISSSQQALVYRAASSSTDSLSRVSQIADKLQQLATILDTGTGTTDDNGLPIDHKLLDDNVQQLKSDILSLITTSAGGTDNLLNGNGDYGSEGGVALSIQGINLVAQLSDKLTDINASSVANSTSAADLVEKTLQPLLSTLSTQLANQSNYVQAAAASAGFAVTVNTNALALSDGFDQRRRRPLDADRRVAGPATGNWRRAPPPVAGNATAARAGHRSANQDRQPDQHARCRRRQSARWRRHAGLQLHRQHAALCPQGRSQQHGDERARRDRSQHRRRRTSGLQSDHQHGAARTVECQHDHRQ